MAGWNYQSNAIDPFNSDTQYYMRYRSNYYSGSDPVFTVPSSPNFPPSRAATPTRYFYEFPGVIDLSDVGGSRPILLRNTTDSVNLTRVTGTPSSNQYRVSPTTSARRSIIEFHSGLAGKTIAYDLYCTSGIINGTQLNDFSNNSLTTADITVTNNITAAQLTATTKIIPNYSTNGSTATFQGNWTGVKECMIYRTNCNLDTTASFTIAFPSSVSNIFSIAVWVWSNVTGKKYYFIYNDSEGSYINKGAFISDLTDTYLILTRTSTNTFDSANFNDATIYVSMTYN